MVEMTIGSRFYWKGKLCQLVEAEIDPPCGECVFYTDIRKCRDTDCFAMKGQYVEPVYFKEVKE